jgi:hypothetical protein
VPVRSAANTPVPFVCVAHPPLAAPLQLRQPEGGSGGIAVIATVPMGTISSYLYPGFVVCLLLGIAGGLLRPLPRYLLGLCTEDAEAMRPKAEESQ